MDDELLREIASVGGGYGCKIEACMKEMRRIRKALLYLRRRIERSRGVPLLSLRLSVRLRRRFYNLRQEAYKQRKYLIIYREALGLIRHREVFEIYDIESIDI